MPGPPHGGQEDGKRHANSEPLAPRTESDPRSGVELGLSPALSSHASLRSRSKDMHMWGRLLHKHALQVILFIQHRIYWRGDRDPQCLSS